MRSFAGHAAPVFSVAIAPDGRTALSGSFDHTLKLWDLTTGKELRSFTGHISSVTGVAITTGGQTALSSGTDGTLRLWDLASGKELRMFTGHTGMVIRIAIAQDGRTAVSASEDHTLKLWNLASGKELRTFTSHSAGVTSAAISRDGRTIFSGSDDKTLRLWDFRRGPAQRAFEFQVAAAQVTLKQSPHDATALATLGEWYAFRGMDQWAIDFLGRARAGGAAVVPLTLARCYWNLDRFVEARREFQIVLEQSNDTSERTYLIWCIAAIDGEPTREQREKVIAAAEKLKDQANQEMAAGHTQEAVAHLAIASASIPEDSRLSEKVASLQAWFGQDAELAITVRRAVEHVRGTSDPSAADRAAKIGLLRPTDDKAQLEELLALAHRAVDLGKGNVRLLPYYQMALGMAEYRNGHYAAADQALSTAAHSAPQDPYIPGTSAFYRAMSLFRQGKESKARALAAEATARMKPLPADEKNPLAGNAAPGDLILWMAYKEAMTLLNIEANPATQSTR